MCPIQSIQTTHIHLGSVKSSALVALNHAAAQVDTPTANPDSCDIRFLDGGDGRYMNNLSSRTSSQDGRAETHINFLELENVWKASTF